MDANAPQFLIALEASGLGLAIRQSPWVYPLANVGHVVSVALFAGAVAMLDLQLLGVLRGGDRVAMLKRVRCVAMGLFAAVALTGLQLFIAERAMSRSTACSS